MKKENESTVLTPVKWYNWFNLNWIFNPGILINDLILGQRIPKIIFRNETASEENDDSALSFLCPSCGEMHPADYWTGKREFGNWFGLYCPNCGGIIPCRNNLYSAILRALSMPVWFWFRKELKQSWVNIQKQKMNSTDTFHKHKRFNIWSIYGFSFGGFMYLLSFIISPLFIAEEITLSTYLIGIPAWIIGGIAFGYSMKNIVDIRIEHSKSAL